MTDTKKVLPEMLFLSQFFGW